MSNPLRIAVVSTPRAGNTWIRHLLRHAYQLPDLARHSMTDEDWRTLPSEVVLQLHWRRDAEFVGKLAEHGFRVVTVARHPLDVLISILHFCVFESESDQWLLGAGGSEREIYAAMPRSRAFIEYAKGPRAAELLAVTMDWWEQPSVIGIRYEDCVRDTDAELAGMEQVLGPVRCGSRAEAIEGCSLGKLRAMATNNHFWKGSPGLWRQLLPMAEANEIAAAHRQVVERLNYTIDPDPGLTPLKADRNWIRFVGAELKESLRRSTEGHRAELGVKDHRIAELEKHCDELTQRLRDSVRFSGTIPRANKRLWRRWKSGSDVAD
jgi:hypothetical protein